MRFIVDEDISACKNCWSTYLSDVFKTLSKIYDQSCENNQRLFHRILLCLQNRIAFSMDKKYTEYKYNIHTTIRTYMNVLFRLCAHYTECIFSHITVLRNQIRHYKFGYLLISQIHFSKTFREKLI